MPIPVWAATILSMFVTAYWTFTAPGVPSGPATDRPHAGNVADSGGILIAKSCLWLVQMSWVALSALGGIPTLNYDLLRPDQPQNPGSWMQNVLASAITLGTTSGAAGTQQIAGGDAIFGVRPNLGGTLTGGSVLVLLTGRDIN